jgi:ElaB/YqjD/DUF883 family membrane-anchored ribosome-binding protein
MASPTQDTYNRINGAAQDFNGRAQQTAEGALDRISHDAGEKIGAMASQISDSATEYVESGRKFVKENPEKGVAIAAAVGAVVGGLLALSLRRK